MKLNKEIKNIDIIFLLIGIVITYIVIDNYQNVFKVITNLLSIIAPFIYALIFAYILNPIMKFIEKKFNLKRGIAIAITYIFVIGIFILISIYVIPNVVDSIVAITSDIPSYITTVQEWIGDAVKNKDLNEILNSTGLLDNLASLSTKAGTIAIEVLQNSVSSIYSFTSNIVKIVFGFLVSIYVLMDKDKLLKDSKTLIYLALKEERAGKLLEWLKVLNKMIGVYVGTKALDSLIIGLMALVGLLILNAPYAILLALIVGFTNMIPYFGPLIGEVIGGIVGIFVSFSMAAKIVIFLLVLQQFDAWYLDPKLIGNKVGVRPFFIILAVMIGGGFFGVTGMILGAPIMATINIAYEYKVSVLKVKNKNLMEKINGDK